jgi:hypothetical protein
MIDPTRPGELRKTMMFWPSAAAFERVAVAMIARAGW